MRVTSNQVKTLHKTRFSARRRVACVILFTWALLLQDVGACAGEALDYQRDIQPILAEHCYQCHGPDEGSRQADLRLDVRENAVSPLPSGRVAILPGETGAGELVRRITSGDPDVVMPPPHFEKPLSTAQIAALRTWVAKGATYRKHWAFVPPAKSESSDSGNPIDFREKKHVIA